MQVVDDPRSLLASPAIGRTEYLQRLLASLLIGGPYPAWNSHLPPSEDGVRFLAELDRSAFDGRGWTEPPLAVVSMLDLPRRHDGEPGAGPDLAVLWPQRVWLLVLSAERGGASRSDLANYYDLAAHHHPGAAVDVVFVTPPLPPEMPPVLDSGQRYANVRWDEVYRLARRTWTAAQDPGDRMRYARLMDTLARLREPVEAWRLRVLAEAGLPGPAAAMDRGAFESGALQLASATGRDGIERALTIEAGSLGELQRLRMDLRRAILSAPIVSPLRRVLPWIWTDRTGMGLSLTQAGAELGYELRLTRQPRPIG
jgi:hypothetical protein